MYFNLGLPVRDEQRSQQLYSAYFGFDPATAQKYPDGRVIIRNAGGFDRALHPAEARLRLDLKVSVIRVNAATSPAGS